jgi:hypothetical protein
MIMRMTREVATAAGPMLASPVHARSLESGDLVFPAAVTSTAAPWQVSHLEHQGGGMVLVKFAPGRGPAFNEPVSVNHQVLRVVGGRAGTGLL